MALACKAWCMLPKFIPAVTSLQMEQASLQSATTCNIGISSDCGVQADFTDADVSDVLWDRAVINEAILRNAILQRTVFTSSDLGGADIYGGSCSDWPATRP